MFLVEIATEDDNKTNDKKGGIVDTKMAKKLKACEMFPI